MAAATGVGTTYLFRPRWQGLLSQWKTATRREKSAYAFFLLLGLAFWVGLFAGLILLRWRQLLALRPASRRNQCGKHAGQ